MTKQKRDPKRIEGTIHLHIKGFGFVKPNKDSYKQDIFIPPPYTKNAVEGDLVEVEIKPGPHHIKGPEGKVKKILRRAKRNIAGCIVEQINDHTFVALAPLLGPNKPILVTGKEPLRPGDRIIIEVTDWGSRGKDPSGIALSLLGSIEDAKIDGKCAVEEFELTDTFSDAIEEELLSLKKHLDQAVQKRTDYTELESFTIDPDESKDFDDALSIISHPNGKTSLFVHIADVSFFVPLGSLIDKEAFARGNSVYLPGLTLPMLPPRLSNDLCSLKPGVKRLTVTVRIDYDSDAEVENYTIERSLIQSQKRFTYKEAYQLLHSKEPSKHLSSLEQMVALCKKLKKKRSERGSFDLSLPSLDMKLDEKGEISSLVLEKYDETHQLVEEFMLAANEIVAKHLAKNKKIFSYRIHEEPNKDSFVQYLSYLKTFGFDLPLHPSFTDIQSLFSELNDHPLGKNLITQFIKTMKLACYSTENVGHYALQLEHYTHFTSPIRRYIDLTIHRLLFQEDDPNIDYEKISNECSIKERIAAKAEQSVILLKKLRYLSTTDFFDAQVIEIKPHAIHFEIPSLFLEGVVPIYDLPYGPYQYHKKSQSLCSKKKGNSITIGDQIKVYPKELNLILREVNWGIKEKK